MKRENWECVFEEGGRGCTKEHDIFIPGADWLSKKWACDLSPRNNSVSEYFRLNQSEEKNFWETRFLMCWGGGGKKETGMFFLETDSLRWQYSLADAGHSLGKENPTHCTKMQKCYISNWGLCTKDVKGKEKNLPLLLKPSYPYPAWNRHPNEELNDKERLY